MNSPKGEDSYDVYLGFWINWSHGKIQGATLTLTRQNGGLLVAFLAMFVGLAGTSFWRISCFLLHRVLSSTNSMAQDGVYHQRQAVLRNSESPQNGTWSLLLLGFGWRKRARRPYLRVLGLVLFGLLTFLAFNIAAIFSSRVTTNTVNEVLLSGKRCGFLDGSLAIPSVYGLYSTYRKRMEISFLNYASQCYSDRSTSDGCRTYVKPRIAYSVVRNATCPFDNEICLVKDNLILDSSYLDSHYDFGINSPPHKRFQYRYIHHCAPLKTKGYSRLHNNSDTPSVPTIRYYYGNTTSIPEKYNVSFTFQIPERKIQFDDDNMQRMSPSYDIGLLHWTNESIYPSAFQPIPPLVPSDAALFLMFLSAQEVRYDGPVDDPWYSAHKPHMYPRGDPYFTADEPAGVVGCTVQLQFCNPNLQGPRRCEPLRDIYSNSTQISEMWTDPLDQQRLSWIQSIIKLSSTAHILDILMDVQAFALRSSSTLNTGTQMALPDDQWKIDLEYLIQASLTSHPSAFVEAASGPPSEFSENMTVKPTNTESWSVCSNQKVLSTEYSSFSVLGIGLILGIGSCFIIFHMSIESLANRFNKSLKRSAKVESAAYAQIEWRLNSTFHLQRLAHEELGYGSWTRIDKTVPVTEMGDLLGMVDVSNEKHPLLKRPPIKESENGNASANNSPRPLSENMTPSTIIGGAFSMKPAIEYRDPSSETRDENSGATESIRSVNSVPRSTS